MTITEELVVNDCVVLLGRPRESVLMIASSVCPSEFKKHVFHHLVALSMA
jgi:hypothetical protein